MKAKVIFGNGRKIPDRYYLDDKEVSKAEFDEMTHSPGRALLTRQIAPSTIASSHKAWPRRSDSMGVNPSQKQEAEAAMIKLGVPTEIDSEGRAVLRDTAHQRDLQKALGYFNRDGGYGSITG